MPIFDVFWRANDMNLRLLRQHARPLNNDVKASVWDYVFVFSLFALAVAAVLAPFIVIGWGVAKLVGWL